MNIGEKAMIYAHEHTREEILRRAAAVLASICTWDIDGLVSGRDVAWLVAAGLVKTVVNGAPRVIEKVMSDGVGLTDRVG